MTLEERIEAAIEAMVNLVRGPEPSGVHDMSDEQTARLISERICRAFTPELFADPPTAWIAPWDPSPEMVYNGEGYTDFMLPEAIGGGTRDARLNEMKMAYGVMRDFFLKCGMFDPKDDLPSRHPMNQPKER